MRFKLLAASIAAAAALAACGTGGGSTTATPTAAPSKVAKTTVFVAADGVEYCAFLADETKSFDCDTSGIPEDRRVTADEDEHYDAEDGIGVHEEAMAYLLGLNYIALVPDYLKAAAQKKWDGWLRANTNNAYKNYKADKAKAKASMSAKPSVSVSPRPTASVSVSPSRVTAVSPRPSRTTTTARPSTRPSR